MSGLNTMCRFTHTSPTDRKKWRIPCQICPNWPEVLSPLYGYPNLCTLRSRSGGAKYHQRWMGIGWCDGWCGDLWKNMWCDGQEYVCFFKVWFKASVEDNWEETKKLDLFEDDDSLVFHRYCSCNSSPSDRIMSIESSTFTSQVWLLVTNTSTKTWFWTRWEYQYQAKKTNKNSSLGLPWKCSTQSAEQHK